MKRALAILRRASSTRVAGFLLQDDGTSSDANQAQRFLTLAAVSEKLHHIYTRHSADSSYTQFPIYDVVELIYDRIRSPQDDEILDHTELVWRYQDGREFPVGENRRRCVLVRPKQAWAWRLAR